MRYRTFGKLGWQVSEVGYGTWGIGSGLNGWQGSNDEEALTSLNTAIENGLNFLDTAWVYGRGHSENLIATLKKQNPDKQLYIATKVPPKDMCWPARPDAQLQDVFPEHHIDEYLHKSLTNLQTDKIDLLQFHVWNDAWANDHSWKKKVIDLKDQNLIGGIGISVNTWEPFNVIETLKTGMIDSVQVIYNIFEQQPEDELFPFCKAHNIAVVARVPFDEGSLTGAINLETSFSNDDWRSTYFVKDNLEQCIPRVEALKDIVPENMTLAQMALKFILQNDTVSIVIPGMRKLAHVNSNLAVSDLPYLDKSLYENIKIHRWDREPTFWSQ